jgi:hypothetical protein
MQAADHAEDESCPEVHHNGRMLRRSQALFCANIISSGMDYDSLLDEIITLA